MLNSTLNLTICIFFYQISLLYLNFKIFKNGNVFKNVCVCTCVSVIFMCVCVCETFEICSVIRNIKHLVKKRCHSNTNKYSSFPPVLLTKSISCNISKSDLFLFYGIKAWFSTCFVVLLGLGDEQTELEINKAKNLKLEGRDLFTPTPWGIYDQ